MHTWYIHTYYTAFPVRQFNHPLQPLHYLEKLKYIYELLTLQNKYKHLK